MNVSKVACGDSRNITVQGLNDENGKLHRFKLTIEKVHAQHTTLYKKGIYCGCGYVLACINCLINEVKRTSQENNTLVFLIRCK